MDTLTDRELQLTDLILQQLDEEQEANTSKLAAFEHLEHLDDSEKKERYWYLFRIISRQIDSAYINDKSKISIKLNPSIADAVKELRNEGGLRSINRSEQSRILKLKDYLFGH